MAIVVVADRGRRHEAVGSGIEQAHEQAGARDPGNARVELCPHAVGEVGGDQPVGGLALGGHGPALGIRDRLRDVAQPRGFLVGKRAITQAQGADQRAVHQQVGIAPDRRGEMRIAAQM